MGLLLGTRLRGSYLSVVSAATPTAPGQEVDRYTAVRQYSLGEILIVSQAELGSFEWLRVLDALWLRPPRDPKTGRVGGRVWWWALLFVALVAVWAMVPAIPGPSARDFGAFLGSDRGAAFFNGAWGWFVLLIVFVVFNTVLGEELLFRGLPAAAHARCLR
jgi:membrane protease YdiL (CAAX protease family)